MIEYSIDKISKFIKEQGLVASILIAVLLFTGKVLWGMNTNLNLHMMNDTENIRLLRVICVAVAGKNLALEAACVDAKNDPINNNEERRHSDKLGIGTATDQIGSK